MHPASHVLLAEMYMRLRDRGAQIRIREDEGQRFD